MKKILCILFIGVSAWPAEKMIHVIPHSHWDREWYLPFEQHRLRLVDLMDDVLQQCEADKNFYFLSDGQTILFDDYLEIRPEKREQVRQAILNHQLSYGPQYILPDTYLADAETQVRNHLVSIREAEQWSGTPAGSDLIIPDFFMNLGYFPDTFGNTAQSPQILAGFGFIDAIVGRGFAPEQTGSAFYWDAPDGSRVFTYQFPDWYCNGKDLTLDPASFWSRFRRAEDWSSSSQFLLMNGCDHQPLQKNLSSIIQSLNNQGTNGKLFISNPLKFLNSLKATQSDWKTFKGEARAQQNRNGLGLEDVYSSRLYLKQANYQSSHILECYAEPLAALAHAYAGEPYPQPFLDRAWKLLLQNQVHDDICGCSVDAVHQDMMNRFRQVHDLCNPIIAKAMTSLMKNMAITNLAKTGRALVVFNPTPFIRSEVITGQVDFPDDCVVNEVTALAPDGSTVPCRVLSKERAFTYLLPNDRFRVPFYVTRVQVQLPVSVPSFGYSVYQLSPGEMKPECPDTVRVTPTDLENKFIRVKVQTDGRYSILDKKQGITYSALGDYELRSDQGDEYNFRKLATESALQYPPCSGKAEIVRNTGLEATLCFTQTIEWSARLDRVKKIRTGKSSLTLRTFLTIRSNQSRVDIAVEMDNHLEDYRLRILVPTFITTKTISSEGDFSMDIRPVQPIDGYRRDSYSMPQGVFSSFNDGLRSLTIANKGLTEIEPVVGPAGAITASITLLRCIGELGDWGYFPTPEAQCQGKQHAEFSLLPGTGEVNLQQVYSFTRPLLSRDCGPQNGIWPLQKSFMQEWPSGLVLTAVKKAERRDQLIMRGFNITDQPIAVRINIENAKQVFQTNLLENRQTALKNGALLVPSGKIFTVEPVN